VIGRKESRRRKAKKQLKIETSLIICQALWNENFNRYNRNEIVRKLNENKKLYKKQTDKSVTSKADIDRSRSKANIKKPTKETEPLIFKLQLSNAKVLHQVIASPGSVSQFVI
jgi:hypothetical protein